MGWGDIFTIINKWLPSREESMRNQIDAIKKEMVKLQNDLPTVVNTRRYIELSEKLSKLEDKLKNR